MAGGVDVLTHLDYVIIKWNRKPRIGFPRQQELLGAVLVVAEVCHAYPVALERGKISVD